MEEEHLIRELNGLEKEKWLKIYNIESILLNYGTNISSNVLLESIGCFSFQTIKKLYAMLFCDYKEFLVIDSESLFLKKVKLDNIFSKFLEKKYIFYSSMSFRDLEYKNWLDYKTSVNCSKILQIDFDNNWYFESFDWIYEKRIIVDLFNALDKNLYKKICDFTHGKKDDFDKAIFEIILYNQFIKSNCRKYNYTFIDIVSEIRKKMGDINFQKMYQKMKQVNQHMLPIFIHGWECLRFRDIKIFANLYKKYNIFSARIWLIKQQSPKAIILPQRREFILQLLQMKLAIKISYLIILFLRDFI